MSSLPFKIRAVYTGLVDLEGIARLEGTELVLEFRTTHALNQFFRSACKELRVPLGELEEAAFKHFLWFGSLHLRARSLSTFQAVPGNRGCQLRLRCRPAHFATAREFASRLNLSAVTQELKAMVDTTTPPGLLPPGPQSP
jgi:hypothetical protein